MPEPGARAERGKAVITEMLGAPVAAALEKAGSSGRFGAAVAASALEFAYGDVWGDGRLPYREKSLLVVAALVATGQAAELRNHVRLGIANGLAAAEFENILIALAAHIGFPRVSRAVTPIRETLPATNGTFGARLKASRAGAGGPITLTHRDTSLVVIAALIAAKQTSRLREQVTAGIAAGLDASELEGILVQLVPYLGYPTVSGATTVMRDIVRDNASQGTS